jgi:hypothetical protein
MCVAVFGLALAGTARAFQVIDTFREPSTGGDQIVTEANSPDTRTGLDTNEVVGGARIVSVNQDQAGTTDSTVTIPLRVSGTSVEQFRFDNPSGYSGTATVTYDANGSGLGLDLSMWPRISVDVISAPFDGNRSTLAITLTDGNTNSGTVTQDLVGGNVVHFPLSSYSGVNMASLDSIVATITAIDTDADVTLDFIRATPEPGVALLLGLVGIVVLVRRPRRD